MNRIVFIFSSALFASSAVQSADDDYKPGPDSIAQPNVPKGELIKGSYTAKEGSVFPGTGREYQVYLPASYNLTKAASWPFMVFQDGVIYNAPVVFDNLIAKHELPPLIGIFIKPGVVPAANENALPRYNRSYEYDSVSDTYARFLIDEFLPAIEAKHGFKLSADPNDAAISGNSSGGICAFMAAWHRPDRFRRVFSGVGTYVGIHGADQLPVLVRKMEPRPLRVYLQSGEHDNNLYCGDWWMANQTMERALTWAGYDVNHTWGTGGHNAKHATAIFPDVLRWLWRDFSTAKEIKANPRGESKWRGYEVIGDGKWEQIVTDETLRVGRIKPSSDGVVYGLNDGKLSALVTIDLEGKVAVKRIESDKTNVTTRAAAFQPGNDGSMYFVYSHTRGSSDVFETKNEIVRENKDGTRVTLAEGLKYPTSDIELIHDGAVLITSPWQIAKLIEGQPISTSPVDPKLGAALLMVVLSPDESMLYTQIFSNDGNPYTMASFQLKEEGSLAFGQKFYLLESSAAIGSVVNRSGLNHYGLCVDTNGWLYVATALGIQVCDQAGRVNFIIPTPQQPHDVCFGGKDLGELFIACGDKIYKRTTKARGIVSGQHPPIKPAPPKL